MVATAASVAAKLPWKQILASLPAVVEMAQGIWRRWQNTPASKPLDATASPEAQLLALSKRIEALETNEKLQSEVVSRIAEQLQAVALELQGVASDLKRSTRAAWFAIAVSIVAIALAGFMLVMFEMGRA